MGISNYAEKDGEFRRKDSAFRNHIEVGGKYPPEKGRYHLYVSWACPWGTPPHSPSLPSHASLSHLSVMPCCYIVDFIPAILDPWGEAANMLTSSVASRTLVVRELKGLQEIIPRTVVHYHMGDKGWRFVTSKDELEGSQPDPLYNLKFLRELYLKAQPDYDGRFTVPVLWDKQTETIVNNESRLLSSPEPRQRPPLPPSFLRVVWGNVGLWGRC